ncbi:MAG: PKD domain-containing protein [Bacteroidales bacterium]
MSWTITNGGCNTTDNVTIYYEKAANAGPAQDLCSTLAATLGGNTPAAGTGTWTLVSGPGTVAFTPTVNTPAATATVSLYGTYIFKWTIDNGGVCSTNQNVTINYNPAGEVDQPTNQILCNGDGTTAINFTTTNVIGTTTYSWTNSVPGIGLAASGSGNIVSFTAINASTAPVVATIVVMPTLTNGPAICVGTTKTFTITVNPTPTLSTTLAPADVCSNTLFSYPPASATVGTTFNWSRASVAEITPAGPTAGINNPNETLINITSVPIAVTYQYTLAANGCSNIQNVVVNIKPEPVITAGQNPSACSGNMLNYQILLNNFLPADNVTFTWGAPVLNPVNPSFTGGTARPGPSAANITDTFTNTMGVLGTATYTVTPFKNGCTGTPATVVITVGSEPVLDPGLNAFACSNTPIGLILNVAGGSVIPTYYNIISKTVAPGLTDVGNALVPNGTAPANYLSGDKFTNTTGVDKTVTYRVQPILAPTCIGAAVDVVITIRPQPVIFPAQTKSVCSQAAIGKEILLSPPNTPAGSIFNWPIPVISDASVQGTSGVNVAADPAGTLHINDQIHNYSAAPITATYTVTPISFFGCSGTPSTVVITVNPEPTPQPITGRDKICVTDKNIVYNVTAVGGSTFHWTVDPAVGTKTFDFNTNAILIDAAAVAGSGNISVYETNSFTCNGVVSTLPVQVYAQPVAENIIGNAIVCANSTQVYNVTNRVGSTYSWTVPGGAAIIGDPSASSITVIFANVGGTIAVRETNAAGCITNHIPKAVTVNPLPTAAISGGGMMCLGGSINLTVNLTGSGPYTFTYAYNGTPQPPVATAASPYTLNVTLAGTYTIVNVSDLNCTNNGTGMAIVTYFPQPTGTISGTAEMCKGGSATLTMSFAGVAPYTFTYTDGTTPVTVVGYLTNVYTVSVSPLVNTTYTLTSLTDGNTCAGVLSGSAVISVNLPPALTLNGTNLICYNVNTGAVNMTITNGTAPFGISWTGPDSFTATTQNISSLEAGYYAVVVNDTKGCTGAANITLTQPPVLNGSAAGTNITCFGASDGTITISGATGGAGTYEYSINGGAGWQVAGSFAGLTPGTYNVMMRDAANPTCILVLNNALLLTAPAVLNATVVKTDVNCFGTTNGSIVISLPTGGYGTYEYSINGGAGWQGAGSFSGLTPGSYDVRIRDKAQPACFKILNPAVVIAEPVVLSATVNSKNIACFGSTDGTITITAPAGGNGTYEYSINGGGSWQPSGSYTALAPGTYNVQIRDAAFTGCLKVLNAAVVISQPAVLQANVASTNVTCNGANDGIISITAPTGGAGTYGYSIDGGTTFHASGSFNGLLPAIYNVQIRDALNPTCVITLNSSLTITEPNALGAVVTSTNVTCNVGANDGTITVSSPTGGYGTYEYNIGGLWQATGNFTGLSPATYVVSIRDKAHPACVIVLDNARIITQPAALAASVATTNVTCNGASDGIISITGATGGYGTYQYSINGGTTWQVSGTFTNLAPTAYNVQIRDAANTACVVILNPALSITQPPVLIATLAHTNVTCFGGNDGTITISSPVGGYGTYEYSVNGGGSWQASGNFTALTPGLYFVLIRDAAHTGCIIILNNSYAITQPPLLAATVTKTDVTCKGANDGAITISAPSGGYGTYQYSVDGGTSWVASGNFVNLVPATYDVRMRDGANTACSVILYPNMVITEPVLLALTSTGDILLDCFGDLDGVGTFYSSGGTMPYTFHLISNNTGAMLPIQGFNSQSFFNAGIGAITVSVTDMHGCFAQATINVTQPALLTPGTIAANQVLCAGDNPAQLTETVPAAGGPGAYNYQWQYGTTAAGPFINIAGATVTLYTPPAGANNTLYYRRMITSGICTPVFSNVIEVLVNPKPVAVLSGGETICPAQTSVLKVNMMVGTGPFELDIDNLGTITGYVSGADIVVSPAATTTYQLLRVRDANACEVLSPSANLIGSATVTVRALPAITTSPVNKTTCEFGMVTFNVAATGTDLTYQWYVNTGSGFNPVADGGVYFGATNSTLSLFGATRLMNGYIYHVVVSGCSSVVTSADATLTVNTVPEIVIQPKDSTTCLNAGAAFSVTATGTNVTYQWQVNKGAGFINVIDDANFSGSNLNSLTVTNAQAAFNNFIFRVVLSGTCGIPVYSDFAVLRVNLPPTVSLNPANKATCDGTGPVVFSANGSGVIDSLRWQVFSGGVWSDVHDNTIYSGSSSQQLTLSNVPIALNGNQYRLALKAKCVTVNTGSATLTVNPNPVVNFSAVDPIHACGNVPLVINGNPTGGSGTWLSHLWTGDIGPLNNYFVQSPTFTTQIAGTYALNYKVKDNKGCYGNGDVTVIVDAPDATFNQDKFNDCTPATVTFTKDMTGVAKFWWDFGDGSPKDSVNANPVHIFTNINPSSIEYHNVKLTVRSPGGCLDSFTSTVTVYPVIDATFTTTPAIVCSGNAIVFTSLPGASRYFWDFGDGVSGYFANTTSHLYTNFTTAPVVNTVTLTTTSFYNCTDVKTLTITVMPVPIPQFTAIPVTQIYNAAGNPVTFTNTTNPGTWTWLWKFGDATTSTDQDPTHTYTGLGIYDVTLVAGNTNCSDSVKHTVIVTPIPPVANFDSIPSGCEPLNIDINNTSLNTNTPGTTYRWDFGDGSTSTAKNPTYTYFDPGTYHVELIVTGPGGTSSKSQIVNAYPSPKANFDVSPTVVFVNDAKVRCFNLSQNADSYLWEFGDGDTSKVKEPYHKYMEEGVYDITLWAYSNNGCSNKYVLSPAVTVEPSGQLRFSTVFTPSKDGPVEMDHLPTGGVEIDQFFFPPIRQKVIEYKLQIFNRLGVLIFESRDINKPWNGYYKNKLCMQGVYVWYVEGKYANGQPFKKVGDVTLLH